jgi:hypothetical protein
MKFFDFNNHIITIMARKRKRSIYEKYRQILKKPKLSDEEIDKLRVHMRLLALSITEHVLKSKVEQIF